MNKVIIAGGSGLIGNRLSQILIDKGWIVHIFSRTKKESKTTNLKYFVWNPTQKTIDRNAFEGVKAIINLSGAGITDKRWSDAYKKELVESRTVPTRFLIDYILNNKIPIEVFVNASATGYYGANRVGVMDERMEGGVDYLSHICKEWEWATMGLDETTIRKVIIRIGIVLTTKGGALKEFIKPLKFKIASPLGTGKQNIPWIHIDDLCNQFIFCIENQSLSGVFNATANCNGLEYHLSNKELTQELANYYKIPFLMPNVPPFVLQLMLGEAYKLVIGNLAVSSKKIHQKGFELKYPDIKIAINDLLDRGK